MASCSRSRPWRTYDPRLGVYRAQHLVPAAGGWLLDQVVVLGALLFRETASANILAFPDPARSLPEDDRFRGHQSKPTPRFSSVSSSEFC